MLIYSIKLFNEGLPEIEMLVITHKLRGDLNEKFRVNFIGKTISLAVQAVKRAMPET